MTAYMHALALDVPRLMRLAVTERLLPPGEDIGYAVHAVLRAAFGDKAPQPFSWHPPGTSSGGRAGRLLVYSRVPLPGLLEYLAMFADPVFASVIHGADSSSKTMPIRVPDQSALRFRIRVRPVVRTGKGPDGAPARERDAYSVDTAASTLDARAACYAAWLSDRLAATARVEHCELERYQRTRLLARDRSVGSSRPRVVDGPDAVLSGRLVVTAGDQFLERVVTGIGRFRAFGFGMMLLAPDERPVP